MSLRVINHYPAINAIDIPRNPTIEIQFNNGIVPSSLTYSHISVNNTNTFTSVTGTLAVQYNSNGIADIVTFEPLLNLTADTKYTVYVFATPNSVISTNNEQLQSTYSFSFTTGNFTLDANGSGILSSGTLDTSGLDIPAGSVIHNVPSGILDFYVYRTQPENQEPNVTIDLKRINVIFTGVLSRDPKLYNYIKLEETDVLE